MNKITLENKLQVQYNMGLKHLKSLHNNMLANYTNSLGAVQATQPVVLAKKSNVTDCASRVDDAVSVAS